ncbi:BURP domain-containing protein [Actinidia rufa]|uniref:BURP domain-containing protein n=1 Tax=Actinidia rufa TaxID=165716 RepID=A0A7J0DHZ9_9ERIC|nr:BURP domain-containing protein [Actinidia rufa]
MEFHILPILAVLYVVADLAVASHATLSPEAYWNTVMPNTPMPKAVKDLLYHGFTHNALPWLLLLEFLLNSAEWMEEKSTSVGIGKGGVGVHTGKPGKQTNVGVGKGGVSVSTGQKRNPVYVKPSPFSYIYAATEDQLHNNPNVALFFMEGDLKKGTKMILYFPKSITPATFLTRQVAEKIPFSSEKMPEIMNYFSVKPDSKEAEILKKAVKECEEPGIKGEEKYCTTSLESMVDFSSNKLGKNVHVVSMEMDGEAQLQKYSIAGVEKMAGMTLWCAISRTTRMLCFIATRHNPQRHMWFLWWVPMARKQR